MRNKPRIRFKGFTEDWEQRKLGEFVKIVSGDAPSTFISGNCVYVKVDDLNYSDRIQLSSSNLVNANPKAHLVNQGATIFPKRGAAIMTNKVRIMGKDGYLDTNMMALIPEEIDKDFLFTFIQKTGLYKIADTSTIPQINNKHIEPYMIQVPSEKEQAYIGVVFKKIDKIITLHQRKLEKLKLAKKALLQKLFPKNGSKFPELRFKGFADAWEQCKLGEIFEYLQNNTLSRDSLNYKNPNIKNIHYGDILVKFDEILDGSNKDIPYINSELDLSKFSKSLLRDGDIIFSDTAEDDTVGKAIELQNVNAPFILGGLHTIPCRPLIPFGKGYLGNFLNSDSYRLQLRPLVQGIKVSSISKSALKDTMIEYPKTLDEQEKIGSLFYYIAKMITLHQ